NFAFASVRLRIVRVKINAVVGLPFENCFHGSKTPLFCGSFERTRFYGGVRSNTRIVLSVHLPAFPSDAMFDCDRKLLDERQGALLSSPEVFGRTSTFERCLRPTEPFNDERNDFEQQSIENCGDRWHSWFGAHRLRRSRRRRR